MEIEGVEVILCGACGGGDLSVIHWQGYVRRKVVCACGVSGPADDDEELAALAWNAMWAKRPAGEATRKVLEWVAENRHRIDDLWWSLEAEDFAAALAENGMEAPR